MAKVTLTIEIFTLDPSNAVRLCREIIDKANDIHEQHCEDIFDGPPGMTMLTNYSIGDSLAAVPLIRRIRRLFA